MMTRSHPLPTYRMSAPCSAALNKSIYQPPAIPFFKGQYQYQYQNLAEVNTNTNTNTLIPPKVNTNTNTNTCTWPEVNTNTNTNTQISLRVNTNTNTNTGPNSNTSIPIPILLTKVAAWETQKHWYLLIWVLICWNVPIFFISFWRKMIFRDFLGKFFI